MKNDRPAMTHDDAELDALFASLRSAPAELPDALLARVLADADAVQAERAQAAPLRRAPAAQPSLWGAVKGLFAGALPVTGLLTAGVLGLWVGFAAPVDFGFGFGLEASAQTIDLYPADFEDWTAVLDIDPAQDN